MPDSKPDARDGLQTRVIRSDGVARSEVTISDSFTWKNCHADVVSAGYGAIALSFLSEVVKPSLDALGIQMDKWKKSEDPIAPFYISDLEELYRATIMAFCLSIQSLWERQIREYLVGCARELKPNSDLTKKAIKGNWKDIDKIFYELRGLSLTEFEPFKKLDLLWQLGNVCRHGDGPSANSLWEAHPELWPKKNTSSPFWPEEMNLDEEKPPPAREIAIKKNLLSSFVNAIVLFWSETEYIYLESISDKHPSVLKKLSEMREVRARRKIE